MSDLPERDPRYDALIRERASRKRQQPIHVGLSEADEPGESDRRHIGTIDYYQPDAPRAPLMPGIVQYVLGLFTPTMFLGCACGMPIKGIGLERLLVSYLGAIAVICVLVRWRFRWRAFIPGALTAVLLTPLIVMGAVWVMCGSIKL